MRGFRQCIDVELLKQAPGFELDPVLLDPPIFDAECKGDTDAYAATVCACAKKRSLLNAGEFAESNDKIVFSDNMLGFERSV